MAPDCEHPSCHESMKLSLSKKATRDELGKVNDCVKSKVPKKTLWIALWAVIVVIIIPLFVTGVQVWSEQDSDELRYASKDSLHEIERKYDTLENTQLYIRGDIADIKKTQSDTYKDVKQMKEILIRLDHK